MSASNGLPARDEYDPWFHVSAPSPPPSALAAASARNAPERDPLEDDLLAQTASVVQQVRQQLEDLQLRETSIATQLGQLEQDRGTLNQERQQFADEQIELRRAFDEQCHALAAESAGVSRQRAELQILEQSLETRRERLRSEIDAELGQRSAELDARQSALESALAADREKLRHDVDQELVQQRAALTAERQAHDTERTRFEAETTRNRDEAEQELARQKSDLAMSQVAIEAEREQLADELAQLRNDAQSELEQQHTQLEKSLLEVAGERQSIEKKTARLDEDHSALEAEQSEMHAQKEANHQELERRRAAFEQQLEARRVEVQQQIVAKQSAWKEQHTNDLARERAELQRDREQLETTVNEAALTEQLRADRELFASEREQFQQTADEWYREQASAEESLRRRRERLDEESRRAEVELNEQRRRIWEEIEQEQSAHQQQMRTEKQSLHEQRAEAETEIRRQNAMLESRTRFQMDHLQRTRQEFEQAKDAFQLEYQQMRRQLEELSSTQRLRAAQIDRNRAILAEREQSLDRRQDVLVRLQKSADADARREDNRIAETQQAWELARETQSAENRRQSDLISLHAENLEKRRDRLDRLRGELEQRHQELLETQIAVDEAWAQLSQVTGDDNATERVNQAREQLTDYCRSMREGLNAQRREIDEAREQLEAQKDAFRREDQQQTDSAADRESQLRRREEHLDTVRSQLKEQADSWQHDRDAWLAERLEAERIIGQLLDELSRTGIQVPEEVLQSQLPELPTLLGLARPPADAA